MIPRLAPRRTTPAKSRHELAIEMENDDPMDSSSTTSDGASTRSIAMHKFVAASAAPSASVVAGRAHSYAQERSTPSYLRPLSPRSSFTATTTIASNRRSALIASTNVLEAPLSPAVTQSHNFLLDPSSALTPPVTGPRPLVVSAKRVANYVRRHNSSKRLRRRTSTSTTTSSSSSSSIGDATSSSDISHNTDGTAYCLWRDAGAPPRAEESSSDEEEGETLPYHPNPQGYWEYCYGSNNSDVGASHQNTSEGRTSAAAMPTTTSSWSARRKPPSKGILSRTNRPPTIQGGLQSFLTPPTTPDDEGDGESSRYTQKVTTGPRVQFGSPQAVEFDSEGPAEQLTPLPSEVTRQRYSMMQVEPSKGEADMSVETKRNTALLAEWEDDGPVQVTSSASRRRQQRNTRRSSSIFTPSPNSTSLLDESDETVGMPISTKYAADRGEASPATMVLENLASLCVNSPSIEQPVLTPMSISHTSSSSDSSSSGSHVGAASTTDMAISLGDLNSYGGALASKIQRLPSPDAGNTVGGGTMSLQAIHSVGGALGTGPAHNGRQLSPISRMSHGSSAVTVSSPLTPNLVGDSLARHSSSPTIDIVQTLLKDPSSDQTFQPKEIFYTLAKRDSNTQKSQKSNKLIDIIQSVSPHWDGVLSCLEDLKEQVRFCANTRSNTKFRLPASQESYAKQMVIREWKELEIEFMFELSQALERNTEQAKMLWHTASSLLEDMKGVLAPCTTKHATSVANHTTCTKQTKEKLENDIDRLEEEIHKQQRLAEFREAAEAPYAALLCQAASHIGVCGFRLDDYNGATLQLAYEHPIAGIESIFIYDMAHGRWSARYLSDAFISSPELLPASHPAAKFHESVAMACFADKNGLLQRVRDMEMSDAVLTLSMWLAGLDTATQELVDLSGLRSISIDWPRLSISVDGETTLAILYDESVCKNFQPASGVVVQGGKETRLDMIGTLASLVKCAVKSSTK